ncbi:MULTISPECIES: BMP family ABC transporter substrate-binding protein [unclassified Devosia]|uniref:BMP family lipoprotein n=1 Tax=unclassified Devosia TaxID=196773 RepID=UPI00145E2FED|nr:MULTISPECIES: BMP family ABC transporter substrate-binding protein [unclassified Devosia]MBJ6986790.1 BMP family ABC transporter substrate-binding protein [Devosia sp. MC521]MBJ7576769.1 BMP family ABC transporter substrate-binding protein [Devosia sp. MC532]QMW63825.1 BMP family ABC transporter substrate-binding protein [Devosia sp. MC521]
MLKVLKAAGLAVSALTLATAGGAMAEDLQRAPESVVYFINGTLGDKSFFDSAERGIQRINAEMGIETKTVEGGYDPTRWEAALFDIAESGDYDTIVAGTFTMVPLIEKIAVEFPEIRFVVFDGTVDYAVCGCENVYSILFRQNEGAYVAGALSARLTTAGVEDIAEGSKLGVVGAMPIPVIDDFLVGYEAGAKSIIPEIEVLKQYSNSFADPAVGKEIGKAMYDQGASIVFQVAGASGQGTIEAAVEAGRYVIGVDSDQALLFEESRPETAERIFTSVLKQVDNSVVYAFEQLQKGELKLGSAESLGLKEGAIAIAVNKYTDAVVPADVMEEIKAIEAKIIDGSIDVPTTL